MTLQELGQSIREKREAEGLTIEDVSAHIKISSRILRGIEGGNLDALPHAVYTKGFIRAFALHIRYDPEELHVALESVFPQEFLDEASSEPTFKNYSGRQYPGEKGKRIVIVAVIALFIGVLVGGGWYVAATYGDQIMELVKKPFSAMTGPAEDEVKTQSGEPVPGASSGTVSQNLEAFLGGGKRNAQNMTPLPHGPEDTQIPVSSSVNNSPAPAGVAASEADPSAARSASPGQTAFFYSSEGDSPPGEGQSAQATSAQPSKTDENAQPAAGSDIDPVVVAQGLSNRLVIRADDACWMDFKADGKARNSRILNPGEQALLTYSKSSVLTLGNAGGVTLEHNGKQLGRPGGAGRKVTLGFPESGQ